VAKLVICTGKKCSKRGSPELLEHLQQLLNGQLEVCETKCQKQCKHGCVAVLTGKKEKRWLELTPGDTEKLHDKVKKRLQKWRAA
jgi:NADH:ubiquinone oxidoreductase subunit E